MIIYFTGIDGSGKSTIADEINKKLNAESTSEIIWARYEPKLFKVLISPFKKKYMSEGFDYNSMSETEYTKWSQFKKRATKNTFVSGLLFFIQFIEYSYQIRNILKTRVGSHLIIDRYVLDFIVDQTINYGNIENSNLVRRLLKNLDHIDFIFFIDAEASVAFKRKIDIPSLEYLQDRRKIYSDYIKKLPNGFIIQNNGRIEESLEAIYNVL